MKKNAKAGLLLLVMAAMVLSACSAAKTPAAPTADANAVYTQAAATVASGLTQTAQKNPTATFTPAPPTNTVPPPQPTNTVAPTQAGATQASSGANPTATTSGANPVPTATKVAAPPPATSGDKAEWVSQSPPDGTKVQKSATFNTTFVLKNTGTTTWTKNYSFRYYGGDKLSSPNDLNLTKEVKPGDSIEILFTLIAPDSTGTTNTMWVLSNADGKNFYAVYLKLEITN